MSVMQNSPGLGGHSGNLYEVLAPILGKGLVIDVFARVSVVGIELITTDIRIVVASVDTYLRFAEACNRLNLCDSRSVGLPELLDGAVQKAAPGRPGRTRGHGPSGQYRPGQCLPAAPPGAHGRGRA